MACEKPTIVTTCPLPPATRGIPYSIQLSATGGTEPYTWSISSGSLPTGLTLSTDGLISGTPTEGGEFSFSIVAQSGCLCF